LDNIEKKLRKYGLGKDINKKEHDISIIFYSSLFFKNNIDENIEMELNNFKELHYKDKNTKT